MRCLKPRDVGFQSDGKTIAWSYKKVDKQYVTFKLPCGKCIECRLEYARQWAVRCVHEAKMHLDNIFLTLTYDDAHLTSDKLEYKDFQDFMKRLREDIHRSTPTLNNKELYDQLRIGYFVTGEYGEKTKRPHWHVLIFNFDPGDKVYQRTNERGDRVFSSERLSRLWGKGFIEVGSVTFESAGYVARYAAKKLVHGEDQDHQYHPISKKSSKQAIGKRWLEKFWRDAFLGGSIVLKTQNGYVETTIPRYYEKWLLKHHPEEWKKYVTGIKEQRIKQFSERAEKEAQETKKANDQRDFWLEGPVIDRATVKETIINEKFKRLQSHLKGDI